MKALLHHAKRRPSGQALVEYVVLVAVIAGLGILLFNQMPRFFAVIETQLQDDFRYTYQYGDPKARGPNEGEEPVRHPRIYRPDNFRVFGRGS